ncbi:hypothetical protein L3X38_024860 [Prunus dulcis]|uniref:Uncharacterized protein n=1 Tax=Prunus dulcis TaxID=3755 RepID=A0AAD4W3A8_PRUDU|nr:hypothetical protein L3X38_024860 [Prunus dulcis]
MNHLLFRRSGSPEAPCSLVEDKSQQRFTCAFHQTASVHEQRCNFSSFYGVFRRPEVQVHLLAPAQVHHWFHVHLFLQVLIQQGISNIKLFK